MLQDLDEAVLRRFSKRIYVRLPSRGDRIILLQQLLQQQFNQLSEHEIHQVNEKLFMYINKNARKNVGKLLIKIALRVETASSTSNCGLNLSTIKPEKME